MGLLFSIANGILLAALAQGMCIISPLCVAHSLKLKASTLVCSIPIASLSLIKASRDFRAISSLRRTVSCFHRIRKGRADVVINYLPEEESDAAEVVSVIEATTESRIFTVPGDLRSQAFCEELVDEAADLLGGLDILINNAGYTRAAINLTSVTTEHFLQTVETNIHAPFFLTRAAIPLLPPGSHIIFTSSQIYRNPPYFNTDYAGTKAWVSTFGQALANGLLAANGIKVNVVHPGQTLTNLLSTQGINTEQAQQQGASRPLGRIQQPIEIAPQFVDMVASNSTVAAGVL